MDIVVTNAGRAALINAANTGTAAVIITHVGFSNSAIVPTPAMTALASEFKRIAGVPGEVVADDIIHVNATDASADAYELRSFALYLADGTLFALYGQPAPILEKTASSIAALSIDAVFADINAAQITFGATNFTNPPATTERQGVVELATLAEAKAGLDALRALTPASAQAAILGWLLAQDGAGSALDADLLDGQHGSWYADIIARLGYIPWGPNNDGAGSGLDAGLLAGQLPSFYTDIIARLGFTPLDKAGGTMAGPLTLAANPTAALGAATKQYVDGLLTAAALLAKLLTVDGSGSGLDADLLDGVDGSNYARKDLASEIFAGGIGAATLWSRGNAAVDGLLAAANLEVKTGDVYISRTTDGWGYVIRPNIAGFKKLQFACQGAATLENVEINTVELTQMGQRIWSALSDGSGSGLDADMVDGFHASQLAKYTDFTLALSGPGGWIRLSNGFILQWGWNAAFTNRANNTVTFPTTFPNGVFAMWGGMGTDTSLTENRIGIGAGAISNSQGRIAIAATASGTIGAYWFALGY